MMDIDKIKQKILDLAIRGKLVPQDPNDEPASVLVEKIKAEKEKMVKEGKIKPSKDDSYIYKDSDNCYYENGNKIIFKEPLDVSNNIAWIKGNSILLKMEKALPKGTFFQYIDIDSIDNKTNIINKKILSVDQAPSRASRKVFKESTLFSMVRPYLRNIAFVGEQNEKAIASTGFYVCTPINGIHPKYLFLLLTSDYVVNGLNERMKGDNSPSIRSSDVESFWFPIPPYSYQIKVLSFLDKINLRIDEITRNEFELKKLCHAFKSKMLDYFFGDNSSYKSYYPNYHIKDLCQLDKGKSEQKGVYPYLEAKVIRGIKKPKYIKSGCFIEKGTKVILVDGENSGEVMIVPFDGYLGSTFRILTTKDSISSEYLMWFIEYYKKTLKSNKTGSAVPHLNKNIFYNLTIALPPLKVQEKYSREITKSFSLLKAILS